MPHTGDAPSLAKHKNFQKVAAILVAILLVILFVFQYKQKEAKRAEAAKEMITGQIYPNYKFAEHAVQIDVQLIPEKYGLSREAGGWVITPAGSSYRIDYDVPVIIEYNDGRKFHRQPGIPDDDGVQLSNGIFRLYKAEGGTGLAQVTIKRNVF